MATTQLTSGSINSSGTFTFPDTDWETIPGMSGGAIAPATGSWHHVVGDFTRTVQHGNCTVQVLCIEAGYQWDGSSWTRTSGSEDPAGYPAALGTLAANQCAIAQVREYRCIATAGSVTNTASAGAGHWMGTWSKGPMGCFPAPIGSTSITVSGTNVNVASVDWSIDHDEIPLVQVVSEETTDARAHATCVHQLRDSYHWAGDIDVSATCGSANSSDTVSYSSTHLPVFTVGLSYGAGQNYSGVLPSQLCPSGLMCMQARAYSRPAESMGITWTLSSQYGSGLRASGSIVDLVDPVYSDDVLTYSFTDTSMTGTVPSASAVSSCCDTPPLMMVSASHQEYIYAETSIGLNLVASDQQVALTSSAALVAHATHFIDQTMDWDSTNQKYIQSSTYSDALDLDVPGSYSMSFQKTSRYEDRLVPNSEDDTISVVLTDACLQDLGLPTADNTMTLHDRALDAIGIDTADWGDHDEHGGRYYGLILVWVQSPLSVQWAQDDRSATAPPSWWVDTVTSGAIPRQNVTEAVIDFGAGPAHPVKRTFYEHPGRLEENWYGEIDAGIAEADLWKHVGDWQRLSATKHLLEDTVIGGPFDMTSGDVTCGEGDPVDHTAYGTMPQSEDVFDWRMYRWLRFVISSAWAAAWTMTVTVEFESAEVTDNYEAATDDRRAGFSCTSTPDSAVFSVSVPASAIEEDCDIDLIAAGLTDLQRVKSITLDGLPIGETIIHEVQLLAGTAGVWIESTDQRPVRYGGEARYSCADSSLLGTARTPEEYGGWWATGGHAMVRGLRNPGRDVAIAPDWGMPFVIRRVTDCGALQDELMQFSAWHGQRVGDWGIEGLYGQIHHEVTDGAMADWVDSSSTPLGLADGAGWITHVPILLGFPVGSQDLLSSGRDQDGATDLPVIVRAGCLRPCGGLNWAHSGAGTAPTFGGKIILYGARIELATDGDTPLGRFGSGESFKLYEEEIGGSTRLVDTSSTNADSWVRFAQGVNEFRHNEYGADGGTNPDYISREAYRSDVLRPDEVTGDLAFGLPHYQVIPTLGVTEGVPVVGGCDRVAMLAPGADGRKWVAWCAEETIWCSYSPGADAGWMPAEEMGEGHCPDLARGPAGRVYLAWADATGLTCRVWNGTWGAPMALLTDLECPSFTVSAFWGRAYVVGLKDNGGAWDLYAWRAPIVAGEPVVETGSETLVASSVDEVSPTIVERPDGVLHVSYLTGGALEMKRSNDGGSTWEAVP